jgi:GTPase SAR1 family protein
MPSIPVLAVLSSVSLQALFAYLSGIRGNRHVRKCLFSTVCRIGSTRKSQEMATADPLKVRLALIGGEQGTGASSMFHQLFKHEFPPYGISHIGAVYESYSIEIDSRPVIADIFLLPTKKAFKSIVEPWFRRALGLVAVYDLTMASTFAELTEIWIPLFLELADPSAKVVIVGNKVDLVIPGGQIELMAREFARENGYLHHTVSAKTGEWIDLVFEDLIRRIVRKLSGPTAAPADSGDDHRREISGSPVHP